MNIPAKYKSYTKINQQTTMMNIDGLIDCVTALEQRIAIAEAKLAKCEACCASEGCCEKKAPVKKTTSK